MKGTTVYVCLVIGGAPAAARAGRRLHDRPHFVFGESAGVADLRLHVSFVKTVVTFLSIGGELMHCAVPGPAPVRDTGVLAPPRLLSRSMRANGADDGP
jgi:hypothetical protein